MRSDVIVRDAALQLLQMKTWFGVSNVSEKMTVEVSGETAKTFPKALLNWEAAEPLKTIAPFCPKCEESTPRYALVPVSSKIIELGETGKPTGVPATKVDVVEDFVSGTIVALHVALVGFAVAHAVVVTYAVGLVGAVLLLTSKLIADVGYIGSDGLKPPLQVGGVQEAITDAAPTAEADTVPTLP